MRISTHSNTYVGKPGHNFDDTEIVRKEVVKVVKAVGKEATKGWKAVKKGISKTNR